MRSRVFVPMVFTTLAIAMQGAWAQAAYEQGAAAVVRAESGRPLASARGQTTAQAAALVLRARGRTALTLAATRQVDARSGPNGVTHTRLEQSVDGLPVYGAYAKAAFDRNGDLVHLIDHLAPVPATGLAPARIDALQALTSVVRTLHPSAQATVSRQSASGNTVTFEAGRYFWAAPTVQAVAVPLDDGSMTRGWLVQTWSRRDNQLHYTLVGGDGRLLHVEARTNTDSYHVFKKSPSQSSQETVFGPGAGNTQSPSGWLNGLQTTVNIKGNNASAYLDTDANNGPDSGGTAVSGGNFLTTADLSVAPSTAGNKAVAVQNLFYLSNVMHDLLYGYGFNEANGNFQVNNFGKGGSGNDPVLAEAQDGSGTDNANFATPNDGQSPRMQMYLWTGAAPSGYVTIGSNSYGLYGSAFGPALTLGGTSGQLAVYNDGSGVSSSDACEASTVSLAGKIAVVDRGACDFTVKVLNAQKAGAVGVVIVNNVDGAPFGPGGTSGRVKVSSGMVSLADGATIKAAAGSATTLRKNPITPLQIDGDIDSDIVFHEYGHGLTWRMIGGMSGPLAGAIGEGAADVNAFLVNKDDIVGEYAFSNPAGIRRHPYAGYPLTYSAVTGAEVHDDGEIYAGAMWRVLSNYLAAGFTHELVHADFVNGMNFTPATPTFEDMRDGMLQAVEGSGRECFIWRGFAASGIGVGAKGTVSRRKAVTIVESFALPAACQ